jgi:hypothetical protein
MKKAIYLLVIILIATSLVSCGASKKVETPTPAKTAVDLQKEIVGNWDSKGFKFTFTQDGKYTVQGPSTDIKSDSGKYSVDNTEKKLTMEKPDGGNDVFTMEFNPPDVIMLSREGFKAELKKLK